MPRYRFRWEVVPRWLTRRLVKDLGLEGDPVVALQKAYGMRPREDFVKDAWPVLRDVWLVRDREMRSWVVDELHARRLGDRGLPARSKQQQLAYLASCRNSASLREVVLAAFRALGDVASAGADGSKVPTADDETAAAQPGAPVLRDADEPRLDLDLSLERAWAVFAIRLQHLVEDLRADQIVLIELPSAYDEDELVGASPFVQYTGFGDGHVRAELASNAVLDDHHLLDDQQVRRLAALGWTAPGAGADPARESANASADSSVNFWADSPAVQVDAVVQMTITAVRDVFGVPHPSFLTASGFAVEDGAAAPRVELGIPTTARTAHSPDGGLVAVLPTGPDHLAQLIDLALTPMFGHAPTRDEDGDIPVRSGSAMVFVRQVPDGPVVELFSPLLLGVDGSALMLERITRLNRRVRFVSFFWDRGTVFARIQLYCRPFVADHLRHALSVLSEVADSLDDELRPELGGTPFFGSAETDEPEPEVEADQPAAELPPELQTILQLDPEGERAVTPALAAKICNHDGDLVLRFIRIAEQETIAWRSASAAARDSGDDERASVCEHESAAWDSTVDLLRDALRMIAED